MAGWVEDDAEKRAVWELFLETPEPLGWGRAGMAGYGPDRWRSPAFTPLRLEPWRVQVMSGDQFPTGTLTGVVWRSDAA